jgi:RNA polymerase sigma-70 factor (ECF subfamily)
MRPDELPRIAHDLAAMDAFYRDHVEGVQRFVARRVDDPRFAADLTAEVFLAAIAAAPSYRPGRGAPDAWLYGIARNIVSAERRRAGRERRAHADFEGRRLLDETTSCGCRSASTRRPRPALCTPRSPASPTASARSSS